jgi:hypothetical protein
MQRPNLDEFKIKMIGISPFITQIVAAGTIITDTR